MALSTNIIIKTSAGFIRKNMTFSEAKKFISPLFSAANKRISRAKFSSSPSVKKLQNTKKFSVKVKDYTTLLNEFSRAVTLFNSRYGSVSSAKKAYKSDRKMLINPAQKKLLDETEKIIKKVRRKKNKRESRKEEKKVLLDFINKVNEKSNKKIKIHKNESLESLRKKYRKAKELDELNLTSDVWRMYDELRDSQLASVLFRGKDTNGLLNDFINLKDEMTDEQAFNTMMKRLEDEYFRYQKETSEKEKLTRGVKFTRLR